MTDIKSRLVDGMRGQGITLPNDEWLRLDDNNLTRIVERLLRTPGIATVELPEASGPWIVDGSLIYVTSSGAVEMRMPNYADAVKTRSLAAALLAAAVQAQEEQP